MARDTLPTVWPASPHTLAKHQILRHYLQAWFPILSKLAGSWRREPLFIDGFAGPGEYEGGEPGSPVIAIKSALEHSREFSTPVHFVFIEEREDRYDNLRKILASLELDKLASPNVGIDSVLQGDCDVELRRLLQTCDEQGRNFGPALAFLDQFGYGAVSMDLIKRIMSWPQCEVFSYLNARDLNRWIPDLTKAPSLDRAFGDDRWRKAIETPEKDRRHHLLYLYQDALREIGRVSYVQAFTMFDGNGDLLYWLLFCTNSLRGLEEMKRSMWSVDKRGSFHFSDRDDPSQMRLLEDEYSQAWLADRLEDRFNGQRKSVAELREYVLISTPCYLFKQSLEQLRREERIEVEYPPDVLRKSGFGSGNIRVQFKGGPLQPLLFG